MYVNLPNKDGNKRNNYSSELMQAQVTPNSQELQGDYQSDTTPKQISPN